MSDVRPSPLLLLACFAEFYEEVASIKIAIQEGRLPSYLTSGDETPPTRGADLALRVSSRLASILQMQARDIAARCTATEVKAYTMAQYTMASLADEIFILDPALSWTGRDAWLDVLLETRLFRTDDAGQRVFSFIDQVLRAPNRTALHADLASVFLLALQLGFQGRYRGGEQGRQKLRTYRHQLYRFAGVKGTDDLTQHAFTQAYEHLVKGEKEGRRAPMSRWYTVGRLALIGYLAISTLIWVALTYPFQQAFGG